MAFDIFAFLAVVFFILLVLTLVGLIVFNVKKNTYSVGDLVRTTFTATPTVLTTALFGVNGEYATTTYGWNYEEDATNALHCDMPKGVGTYSTWLSDGGQSFKLEPWATSSQLYILQQPCTQTSDCSATVLPCGPGYFPEPVARDPRTGEKLSGWIVGANNPAETQCPDNSYCNVCAGAPAVDPRCPNPSRQVGTCVNVDQATQFTCTQAYASVSQLYCAVNLPVTVAQPPVQRFNSCSVNQNYESITFTVSGVSATCGSVTTLTKPPYCEFEGNPMCLPGQECVTNWSSTTGWCTTQGGCGSTLSFAPTVCSGTVYPSVALKTTWIAEGTIESLGPNGTFNVQWNRVQNTYPGIGPSLAQCASGTSNCSATQDPDLFKDLSWVYSDCRFVVTDDPDVTSRHFSVTRALLGSPASNPQGLGIFSTTDASFSNNNLQNLLFVSISNSGSITNNWSSSQNPEFKRSAWDLQSVAVPKSQLERIFFYSIHPFEYSDETVGWHALNYS
jgi:hypothetical protein